MSYLDRDLSELSAADLLAMIERIESGKSIYDGMFDDLKTRLTDELDYRILCLVKNSDAMRN